MKVYFDNVNFSSNSGPNTFGSRLAEQLEKSNQVRVVSNKEQYDIFLCFIEPTHAPRVNSKLVHRLDGIWFKPDQFETHNELIKWAYYNSRAVVWQSNFDKQMTTKWWGDRPGRVIGNGIKIQKPEISREIQEIREKYENIFVSSASWHRQKRLKENIELFQKNSSENDAMLVLGRSPDCISEDPRVIYLGQVSHSKCLEIYSVSDWMIHLAWLDHCPNVVVESISQNCPVICTNSGGTKEIVKNNGLVIEELINYQYQLCDYDSPPELKIEKLDLIKPKIDNDYLSIEKVAEKYTSLFKSICP